MNKKIKSKKRLLVIVHGAKMPICKKGFLCRNYNKVMNFLTSPRGMLSLDYRKFKKYMKPHYDKVILFKWSGGIFRFYDLERSANRLKKILEKKKKRYNIDIAAFSLGGFVSERALEMVKELKIGKFVLIGAVHEPKFNFEVSEIVHNVYSEVDKLALLANNFYGLAFRKDFKIKHKKVKNYSFRNLKHDDLSQNLFVADVGKNLYDVYRGLLLDG
jgi:hypothetical protein